MCQVPPWSPRLKDLMNRNLWLWVSELIGCHVPFFYADCSSTFLSSKHDLKTYCSKLESTTIQARTGAKTHANWGPKWLNKENMDNSSFHCRLSLFKLRKKKKRKKHKQLYWKPLIRVLSDHCSSTASPTLEENTSASSAVCRQLTALAALPAKMPPVQSEDHIRQVVVWKRKGDTSGRRQAFRWSARKYIPFVVERFVFPLRLEVVFFR